MRDGRGGHSRGPWLASVASGRLPDNSVSYLKRPKKALRSEIEHHHVLLVTTSIFVRDSDRKNVLKTI